jgi:hypothetical protein
MKKRCPDYIGAGGLGVSPSFKKSPNLGGLRGLIGTISEISKESNMTKDNCLLGQ